jgi:hypothetical protein
MWAVIAAVVVIALAAVLVHFARGSKVTQAPPLPNPQQTPVLRAPAPPNQPQPNVLNTDVEKPPLPQKPPPPPEVVAYLEHLKKVDRARENLQLKETEVLLNLLPQATQQQYDKVFKMMDPDSNVSELDTPAEFTKAIDQLNHDWQALARYFLSVQAPDQCATLAGLYYEALRDVIVQVSAANQMLAKMQLGSLMTSKGKSASIDDKLDAADGELSAVCTKYGIDKSFAIKSDRTGGTGLFTLPGM